MFRFRLPGIQPVIAGPSEARRKVTEVTELRGAVAAVNFCHACRAAITSVLGECGAAVRLIGRAVSTTLCCGLFSWRLAGVHLVTAGPAVVRRVPALAAILLFAMEAVNVSKARAATATLIPRGRCGTGLHPLRCVQDTAVASA